MSGAGADPELLACFSPDYATARFRFRAASGAAGATLEAHPIEARGPHGSDLTIDVARLGPATAPRLLIVSSGLHGVEGFFGSAVQLAWLGRGGRGDSGADVAVLVLHGLDPFGFAWLRRFDEGNVDLNRNFLLPGEDFSGSPARYGELDRLINPRHGPRPFGSTAFLARAGLAILRHGFASLKAALARGQYEYPFGLFFGGHGPAPARRIIETNLARWVGEAGTVMHIDFHTGLGRRGRYSLLFEPGQEPVHLARLEAAFGPGRVEANDSRGTAYPTRGDLGIWCRAELRDRAYQYLCAEFGTYPALRVLAALRAENQAHHWLPPGHPGRERAKQDLREAFVPADPNWRSASVAQALAVLDQALAVVTGN